jgi:copper chaperone CopZ
MRIERIIIANLKYGACEITIKKALLKIAGVMSVRIDHEKNTVTVIFEDYMEREKITNKLRYLGYPEATQENDLLLKT